MVKCFLVKCFLGGGGGDVRGLLIWGICPRGTFPVVNARGVNVLGPMKPQHANSFLLPINNRPIVLHIVLPKNLSLGMTS